MIIRTILAGFILNLTGCLCSGPEQTKSAATPPSTSGTEVNLAIWSNYITIEMIEEFTAATGIKINVSGYSSNEELLAKLQAGATGYDVAVPSDYMVEAMIGLGLLEKLDRSQLSNFSGLDPNFLGKAYDQTNDYSMPYGYALTGIATNSALHPEPVKGWGDLLEDPSVKGKMAILDDVREAMGAALKLKGHSLNSTDDTQLATAKAVLINAKSRVKAFTSEPIESMVQGDFAIAHMYSSDALQARAQSGGKVQFFVPQEGTTLAIDNLVIPKGARNIAAAHQLINYLISASANQKVVQKLFLGPVVRGTAALLPEAMRTDPVLFPSEEILKKCEMMIDLGDAATKYDRIWTEVKASAG
jgi:spermidine/putrescine transport system substrate-binding protein